MKFKRVISVILLSLLAVVILLLVFLSTIAKYLIEKHAEEYTGRRILLENLHINVFTGNIRVDQLRIYEAKSNKIFIDCPRLELGISVSRLIGKQYDISSLVVEKPLINITQRGNHFNYDDLIKRFNTAAPSGSKAPEKPVRYYIRNLRIDSARLNYVNTSPPSRVEILNWDLEIPLLAYNEPQFRIRTGLSLASGGRLRADLVIYSRSAIYRVKGDIQQLNIAMLYPYLKDYLKVSSLDGLLDADLSVSGNLHHAQEVAASGRLAMEKFAMVDNTGEKLTSFEKMDISVDSVNTKSNFYRFKSLHITRPYLKFAMYDDGYNFQRILTSPAGSSTDTSAQNYANLFIMMADYLQGIMKNYIASDYSAEQVNIEKGHMIFTDYTHGDKFQYDLDSLYLFSDRVNSNRNRITMDIKSLLNRSGVLTGTLGVNPRDFMDMDIDCRVHDLLISDFNPYSKYYVATPFLNGSVTYTNKTTILKRKMTSINHLEVIKIEAGKKVKSKTAMNIPVRLAVSLLKDVHGNIRLDIPVEGSLDDPKFKWGKVIWQVIKNILVKAATAPFRFFASAFGGKETDYKEVSFDYLQNSISSTQQKTLDNLARVLSEKKDLRVQLLQVTSRQDEAEAYALRTAKSLYLGIGPDSLTADRQQRMDSLSIQDSLFNAFLNTRLPAGTRFSSVQEKCIRLIGEEKINALVSENMERRNQAVQNYLVSQKGIPAARVVVTTAADQTQLSRGENPKFQINISVLE